MLYPQNLMKSFQFESISLLSHRDKKARKVSFHPHRNLIRGENHTGKSSLVKHLFITLGAKPLGTLEQWDPRTVSAVRFKVDGESFTAIHHNGSRSLYDSFGKLLKATDSHATWAEAFATLVGFKLILTSKKTGQGVLADPSCFFLPFYIDQDGSWRDKWDTFPATMQYAAPVRSILEYFSGIKPAKYYDLKSEHGAVSKEADALASEMKLLERARSRLSQTLPVGTVNLSEDGFEEEIRRLTTEANELNHFQETLRAKHVRESEVVASINHQIQVALASLQEYAGDQKYLSSVANAREIVCPTCGAEHEQSFLHYLGYAEDARILEELTRTLQRDLIEAKHHLESTAKERQLLRGNYARINEILERKRGELRFREVVESHGSQAAHRAFDAERAQISGELAGWNSKLSEIDARLDALSDKKRTKRIVTAFREAYSLARKALNVPDPAGNQNIVSRPNRSGSGGPRLLLAYYAALWKVCHDEHVGMSIPVVIDSPNQQDQDDLNLHVVLGFIAENLPAPMQLIVCVTKHSDAHLDKTIIFDKKYSMLLPEFYEEVEADIGPLYRKMNSALLNTPLGETNESDPTSDADE
ncbi:hypothetical protein [Burkholderia sp. 567]|uniref:hypothetical protein n=1 Tax=Burkholderia sp. 567 TaxID=3156413 RepID=UPI0033949C80